MTSTVYRGTAYEKLCETYLNSLSSSSDENSALFTRSAGSGDKGKDLIGWWSIPTKLLPSGRIRIVAQCKSDSRPVGPKVVRELEGTVGGEDLGLLFARKGFSPGALKGFLASTRPLILLHLESEGDEVKPKLRGAVTNPPALKILRGALEIDWVYPGDGSEPESRLTLAKVKA